MNTTTETFATRTVDLDHRQLLVLDDRAGTRLQVLAGGLWLTEPGDLADRFGAAGEWLRLESRGRAVLEAIGPTRLRVVEPVTGGFAVRWRSRVQRLVRISLSALAPRAAAVAVACAALVLGVVVPEGLSRAMQLSAQLAEVATAAHLHRG